MTNLLVVNRAQCLKCGDIIISKYTHDFVSCGCGNLFVDGGSDYLKRNYIDKDKIKELSLYQDSPWEEVRQYVYRGSRGKNGNEEFSWIALCDMSDLYLEAVIDYKKVYNQTKDVHYWCYQKEVEYRYNHNIKVIE